MKTESIPSYLAIRFSVVQMPSTCVYRRLLVLFLLVDQYDIGQLGCKDGDSFFARI